jgi:hypothetical protein
MSCRSPRNVIIVNWEQAPFAAHSESCRSDLVGAENLIRCTDQGRCIRKNVGTCRATYVPHSVAPAVRQDPDGDLEILVSNPVGVFGTYRVDPRVRMCGLRNGSSFRTLRASVPSFSWRRLLLQRSPRFLSISAHVANVST